MSYKLKNIKYNPLKGYDYSNVSSRFGSRTFYNDVTKKYEKGFHNGIDLTTGTIVIAPEDGEVTEVYNGVSGYSEKQSRGNYIVLKHKKDIYTVYYHLKKNSIRVSKGDRVERGALLAEVGATGHATGLHLHYGIKVNTKWVNPEDYLLGKKRLTAENFEDHIIYTVKQGDTLIEIAAKYGIDYKLLAEINGIDNPDLIYAGDKIKLPLKTIIVEKGDTLSGIAKKYNTTWQKLYEKNKDVIGDDPNLIKVGMVLKI